VYARELGWGAARGLGVADAPPPLSIADNLTQNDSEKPGT
jgi:hypothetical protein